MTTNSQGADQTAIPDSQNSNGVAAPEDKGLGKRPVEDGGDNEEHGTPVKKGPSEKAVDKTVEKQVEKTDDATNDEPQDESWKEAYVTMPDATGQAVIDLLKESNVSPVEANAIFAKALQSEDIKDIDWDVLKSRLGPAKFQLAKTGIEAYYNAGAQRVAAVKEVAIGIMGSEENLSAVTKWAKAKASKDPKFAAELDDLRAGFEAGGRSAKHAANDLKSLYEADPKNKGLGTTKLLQGDNSVVSTGAPLGRTEYLKLMHEGNEQRKPASYFNDIRARRKAGASQGL